VGRRLGGGLASGARDVRPAVCWRRVRREETKNRDPGSERGPGATRRAPFWEHEAAGYLLRRGRRGQKQAKRCEFIRKSCLSQRGPVKAGLPDRAIWAAPRDAICQSPAEGRPPRHGVVIP